MYSRVTSLGIFGLDGYPVVVEADTSQGLPMFDIVGLPDTAVSESRNRVRAAIKNSRFIFPVSRITVNLAPADKRKSGPLYDLPIMLSLLISSYQIDFDAEGKAFIGELSLEGRLRPVTGALPMAIAAKESGLSELYLPKENAPEASVVEGLCVFGVSSVAELIGHLSGGKQIEM
ncbi:MAG: ATP-binding protein, partial [Oscillospiraceae bacterium]|nr:ATP-binding protein [Oscillospiraceae bacterium]